jgi:hypothetical protein
MCGRVTPNEGPFVCGRVPPKGGNNFSVWQGISKGRTFCVLWQGTSKEEEPSVCGRVPPKEGPFVCGRVPPKEGPFVCDKKTPFFCTFWYTDAIRMSYIGSDPSPGTFPSSETASCMSYNEEINRRRGTYYHQVCHENGLMIKRAPITVTAKGIMSKSINFVSQVNRQEHKPFWPFSSCRILGTSNPL